MTDRREFSLGVQLMIVRRATDSSGRIHCEVCGIWCKRREEFEIDHLLSEGMRPKADKRRRLTPAEGQLLCLRCHGEKTAIDKRDQAEAKRREAAAAGLDRPGKKKIWGGAKPPREPVQTAAGPPGLARRGFKPAGSSR